MAKINIDWKIVGTDIHFAAEKLNEDYEWIHVPGPIVPCSICEDENQPPGFITYQGEMIRCYCCNNDTNDEFGIKLINFENIGYPGMTRDSWYRQRNYVIFSILANVRNYDHQFPIISKPTGLPKDVTKESLRQLSNEHSRSCLSLEQVYSYDWNMIKNNMGFYLDSSHWGYFLQRMELLEEHCKTTPNCIRLVFDFDS
jgi:hypothetical protein